MKRKLGFTIVEAVIVLVIIGVMTVVGIKSFKKETQFKHLAYSQAYSTIKTAAYNVFLEKHANFGRIGGDYSAKGLCNDLASFINTTDNNCESLSSQIVNFNGNVAGILPSIVASNGMRFWISDVIQSVGQKDSFGNDISRRFWVVFADIEPSNKNNQIGDDIVPFYVTQYGETVPAGAPLLDTTIMSAEVQISRIANNNNFSSTIKSSIQADNFVNAKRLAWGNTVWAGNLLSYDFSRFFPSGAPDWAQVGKIDNINDCLNAGGIHSDATGSLNGVGNCQTCDYNCEVVILNKKTSK